MFFILKKIKKIFSSKNNDIDLEKLNSIISQLSHDLKNNLVAIRSNAKNITHYVNNSDSKDKVNCIDKAISSIDIKVNHSMTILNMVHLLSTKKCHWPQDVSAFSIKECVQESIKNYPFPSKKYASLLELNGLNADFLVKGNKTLMTSVFYCLIKNAVSSIYTLGEGEASIILEPYGKQNKVDFKFPEINKVDLSLEDDLFTLGVPDNSGNGLNFIINVIKGMNGRVEFKREPSNLLKVALIFP